MKSGFSLVELLIVVSLVTILTVAILTVINPAEQVKKANDAKTQNLISDIVTSALRYTGSTDNPLSSATVTAATLTQSQGQDMLNLLINAHELKNSVIDAPQLSQIFYNYAAINHFSLCYQPLSQTYQKNSLTHFDSTGTYQADCTSSHCYYCLPEKPIVDVNAPTPTPTPADPCTFLDPEYPNFPWTCNYSSRWSIYGCDDYCVVDMGCNGCPPGSRRLRKMYSGNRGLPYSDPMKCILNWLVVQEDYCVPDPYANCTNHPLPSSNTETDFYWGCTNPRRPYAWK